MNQNDRITESNERYLKRRKRLKEAREWIFSLGIAVCASLLIQNYAYAQTKVHNVSMQNTLVEGQRLIEDKWSYRFHAPERGDIVIIYGDQFDTRLVKRVIGLPGETIAMRNGTVYIDEEPLKEPYAKGESFEGSLQMPLVVPEDEFFVLGDNRERSLDSRSFGTVPKSAIEGKIVFRIWPVHDFGLLDKK
ncbi:signal peptidase I [Paenibacillus sp. J5C_2022]|uniref:signal peptidase I n=1 Tax=Paenibacillus sp. J5C2022 TaxID=2977129 RepID=UPI0021D0971F|nr:signal peptidase I [Paenibacillus sp. J5C2022]MCU6707192.1 signal peptidase I [Paenibacillus sp. J5C2022]